MKINDFDLAFSRSFIKNKIDFVQKYKLNFDDIVFSSSTSKKLQITIAMVLHTPALRFRTKNFYFKHCVETKTAKLCVSLHDDTEVLLGNYFHCSRNYSNSFTTIAKHPVNNQSRIVFTNQMRNDSFLLLMCYEDKIDIFHILEKDFYIFKKNIRKKRGIGKIIIIDNFKVCNILNWDLTYKHIESSINTSVFLYYDNFWKVVMQSESKLNKYSESNSAYQELKIFNLDFID